MIMTQQSRNQGNQDTQTHHSMPAYLTTSGVGHIRPCPFSRHVSRPGKLGTAGPRQALALRSSSCVCKSTTDWSSLDLEGGFAQASRAKSLESASAQIHVSDLISTNRHLLTSLRDLGSSSARQAPLARTEHPRNRSCSFDCHFPGCDGSIC